MKIRTAETADIPAMAELLHELFAIEVDFMPDFAVQCRGLELLINSRSAHTLVCEIEEEVVGMCTVQILISTAKGCEVGHIEDLVIELEHRGKGIGTALLRAMEAWATERNMARLQLQADRDNHPALGFYRHHGWYLTNLIGWMKHLPA